MDEHLLEQNLKKPNENCLNLVNPPHSVQIGGDSISFKKQ
jgi:hypothetical protein